jgi:hypothetical protein
MSANWKYFRDEIVINQDFTDFINDKIKGSSQGSTLLIAGRDCKHDPGYVFRVPPGYNLILLAAQYDAAGGLIDASGLSASGQGARGDAGTNSAGQESGGQGGQGGPGPPGNSGGDITLFAKRLINAHLVTNGGQGGKGGTGGNGGAPTTYHDSDQWGGVGYSAPGGGGPGGPGGPGGYGGRVVLAYVDPSDTTPPVQIESAGSQGGDGGDGGLGAMDYRGRFRARNGNPGPRGPSGQPGQPSVSRVTENEYWSGLVNTVGADVAEWAIWLKHLLFL